MAKDDPVPALPADTPKAGETYRHYKGDRYRIVGTALDAVCQEWVVVYEPLYECTVKWFTRPLREWGQLVDLPSGRQGEQGNKVERFTKQ